MSEHQKAAKLIVKLNEKEILVYGKRITAVVLKLLNPLINKYVIVMI